MSSPQIKLSAPPLFGNDAAEDEDEDHFLDYVVERHDAEVFLNPAHKLQIARAFKGEGKSALLRIVKKRLRQGEGPPLILEFTGRQLSPSLNAEDTDAWVREWKRSILQQVAGAIGAGLGIAFEDDAISLVEEAERSGFRSRNIVSAIFDRLKTKHLPVQRERLDVPSPERLVQRWAKREDGIWLFVDDVDENFKNDNFHNLKVASFFIAARDIVNDIPQVRIRAAVRPSTWTTLTPRFEALSKVRQYNHDLKWEDADLRAVLARRIRGYLVRTAQWDAYLHDRGGGEPSPEELIALVFHSPVLWNRKQRDVSVALLTLSRRRPRWLIELAREAAVAAAKAGEDRVRLKDIDGCLESFGRKRIADTVAEFSSQCPELNELIQAFAQQSAHYATGDLFTLINSRILQRMTPTIVGVPKKPRAKDVARLLYQIGFLSGRRDFTGGDFRHFGYADEPELLGARTSVDKGVSWEVHPVFRQALEMFDEEGNPIRHGRVDRQGR